jgi:hypothetical protein
MRTPFPAIAMETDYHLHLGREKVYLSSGEVNANMFVPTVDELFDMKATRSNAGVGLLQLR